MKRRARVGTRRWNSVRANKWLRGFLELPNGIPSHDTLGRVFRKLDPAELSSRLGCWLDALHERVDDDQVCIDGKSLRAAFDRASGKAPLHIVNAWASATRVVLGQVAVDAKENEIVAIPKLLGLIDVRKRLVTIDAIGTQREIARLIVEGGGDYLLRVKDNQPNMASEMRELFADAERDGFRDGGWYTFEETEGDHGRVEVRTTWATDHLDWLEDRRAWAGLRTLVVQRGVRDVVGGEKSMQMRYYISTRPTSDVERLGRAARNHCSVENGLHWVLDVAFDEDHSRARRDNSALNLAALRRLALALLKKNTSRKIGVANKRRVAG
jgi:predicted transposase YbfD/YdcC